MVGHGRSSAGSYLEKRYIPHPLPLCCNYPVLTYPSASIVVTSTLRVKSSNQNAHCNKISITNVLRGRRIWQSAPPNESTVSICDTYHSRIQAPEVEVILEGGSSVATASLLT